MEKLSEEEKRHYQVLLGQGLQIMFQTEGKPKGWEEGIMQSMPKYYLRSAKIIADFLLNQKP